MPQEPHPVSCVSAPTSACRFQSASLFVLDLKIRSLWHRDGKEREKAPLQQLAALGQHCSWQFALTTNLAVQAPSQELVPDSAVTSGAL